MNSDIRFYWGLFLRRLPYLAAVFVLCSAIGVGLALTLPPKYVSSARLLVESAQIPDELAASTVRTAPTEQLQIIEQRLMTRANLIDIANKFQVFEGLGRMSPDEVVRRMQNATEIRTRSGRNQATLMEVSFSATDAETSARVVNEFVTLILNEDSVRRQALAEQTLQFFEQEVKRLNDELSLKSQAIVVFKEANQDALPENLDFRVDRQARLQDQILAATRDRAALTEQRNRLVALGSVQRGPELSPAQRDLRQAREELNSALTIYSENNPRVKLLRARVQRLEAAVANETGGGPAEDPSKIVFELQLAEIDRRISDLDQSMARWQAEVEILKDAIERTPENAIKLEALEREYLNVQQQYNTAVDNLAKAQTGERIEVLAKGERISVIEQATAPTHPNSPNRPLIAGGGVFVGIAFAVGLFILLEVTNRTIRRPADLLNGLTIQPIATIPYLETARGRARRRALQTILIAGLAIGIPVTLWAIHTFYLPLDLLIARAMDKIGL